MLIYPGVNLAQVACQCKSVSIHTEFSHCCEICEWAFSETQLLQKIDKFAKNPYSSQ